MTTTDSHHCESRAGTADSATVVPSAELLAEAASILGLTATARSGTAADGGLGAAATLVVTVVGPAQRRVMQLPVDTSLDQLADVLGRAVDVPIVARLALSTGETIPPGQTPHNAGLRAGSVILVDDLNTTAEPPTAHDTRPHSVAHLPPVSRSQPTRTVHSRRRQVVLGAGAAAVLTVGVLAGGAIFDGPSTTSGAAPGSAQRLSLAAATAWVNGTAFTGPRLQSVPADLDRTGPATGGVIEPAGSSASSRIASVQFIVDPPAGSPYGLSIVTYKGQVAYPPTVTGLPFAQSIPPGHAPQVPEAGTIVASTTTVKSRAQAWAAKTFGTVAAPAGMLGYGLDGRVDVVAQWRPAHEPATIARIQVPLAGTPPDTPAAAALLAAHRAVTFAQAALSAASGRLAAQAAQAATETAALARATTAATTISKAVAGRHRLRHDDALAAARRAVTAAQASLGNAASRRVIDQTMVAMDRHNVDVDKAALASTATAQRPSCASCAMKGAAVTDIETPKTFTCSRDEAEVVVGDGAEIEAVLGFQVREGARPVGVCAADHDVTGCYHGRVDVQNRLRNGRDPAEVAALDGGDSAVCDVDLRYIDVGLDSTDKSVEVRELNGVIVNEHEVADAKESELLGDMRAGSSQADHGHGRSGQLGLPCSAPQLDVAVEPVG